MSVAVVGERPPLALAAEVTDAHGTTYRWAGDEDTHDRPQDITFSTKRGEGFDRGGCVLPRPTDLDFPDLGLWNDLKLTGMDGSVAYEGRIATTPRSGLRSIEVQTAGWMSHARQRKFSEIIVDRDLSAWRPPGTNRQVGLVTSGYSPTDHQAKPDEKNLEPSLWMGFRGPWSTAPGTPMVEAWYDAGPTARIGRLIFRWDRNGTHVSTADANFNLFAYSTDDDDGASSTQIVAADVWAAGASPQDLAVASKRYVFVEWFYANVAAGTDNVEYAVFLTDVAVEGDHGLTRRGDTVPGGFYASDVIKHIAAKYCPKLSTAGVKDTTYPLTHLVFKERVWPYDAWQLINKHHLWQLAVWEDRTLTYQPFDLTKADWQVRNGEDGVRVDPQGDSTSDLANGIVVTYRDVQRGTTNVLTPDTHTELADPDPENPANLHGEQAWTELELSFPATQDIALQVGRAALAEFNQPKAPGTITVPAYIRDAAGHWHQAWRPRADQTIQVTNHPNDRPRLIHETSYNHQRKEITIAVEGPMPRLDAYYDRLATALAAENVSV